jgi:hypothetical protein
LQPAAVKNQSVQRGELWSSVRGKVLRHRIRLQGAGKIQPIILHGWRALADDRVSLPAGW